MKKLTFPMDLKTYQAAKIQSFFNLGLKFSVAGDQLAVTGFNQYPPDDRPGLQELIRQHKSEIMAEMARLQDRLKSLVDQADNFKGLTPEAVGKISEERSKIISRLSPEMVRQIFKNA